MTTPPEGEVPLEGFSKSRSESPINSSNGDIRVPDSRKMTPHAIKVGLSQEFTEDAQEGPTFNSKM